MTVSSLPAPVREEPGSFRDETGRVFYRGEDVLRGLSSAAWANWNTVSRTRFYEQAIRDRQIVASTALSADEQKCLDDGDRWAGILLHERIPFISYPYEWSFGMLRDAALLYLDLLTEALDDGFTIKDGTAFNIQWHGAQPVFIDVPSFCPLEPGEPWVGYRQFCQLFLYPLMLTAYKNVPFQPWLRGSLEGIEPAECDGLMSVRDWFRPGVLTHVHLHAGIRRRFSGAQTSAQNDLRKAGFDKALIQANVRGLRKIVARMQWSVQTKWSHYTQALPYAADDHARKISFVQTVLGRRRWKQVWDLGCNTGEFSLLAAANADYVVALDSDAGTIDRLFDGLKTTGARNILPLVQDLANPSPATGWNGEERQTLAARGKPELTLCLALLHHLAISQNIPLERLVDWLADLTPHLIVEFVDRADPMVQGLLRNKQGDVSDYSRQSFEKLLAQRFQIVESKPLNSETRTLYFAAKRI